MHACIGEGTGNPLQYSCLENPRDGGACWAAIYGVEESRTRLKQLSSSSSNKIHLFIYIHSHHCALDFLCEIIGSILSTKILYFGHFLNLINIKVLNFLIHELTYHQLTSVQFSSVAQSCPTLYDPMNCSMPGLPVQHQFLELTQTHVHCVSDAIQPSHPLSSPSHLALNLSNHQGLFK